MAAPAITGLVALVYAQAAQNGSSIPVDGLRKRLMDTAVPGEAGNNGWHPRYGFGRAIGQAISPEADV